MITHPNEATADPVTSITTWEEVESLHSLPAIHDDQQTVGMQDGLKDVLILDMKVTFQNENESILAAEDGHSTERMDSLVVEGMNSRSYNSPRFATDQTMMSAISELSLHASDVSMSRMEEISPFWKNQVGKTSTVQGYLSSIHATDGDESPILESSALTPVLEPFVPQASSPCPQESTDDGADFSPNPSSQLDVKQEYDMNAFVKIANHLHDDQTFLHDGANTNVDSVTTQPENISNEQTAQDMNSPPVATDASRGMPAMPSQKCFSPFRALLRKVIFGLLAFTVATYPIAMVISGRGGITTRYKSFASWNEETSVLENIVENSTDMFYTGEQVPLENGRAWNMTSKPAGRFVESAPFGGAKCVRSEKSSRWAKRLSMLMTLVAVIFAQLLRLFLSAWKSPIHGIADNSTENAQIPPAVPINQPPTASRHESVIFGPGNRTLTHVKVQVIHHTSPSGTGTIALADIDLTRYTELRVVDLKELLRERQCKVSGVKMELVLRLAESYASELEAMTVKKLREKLRDEGLKVSGRKHELIQRLVELG